MANHKSDKDNTKEQELNQLYGECPSHADSLCHTRSPKQDAQPEGIAVYLTRDPKNK